jgi:hypothetical protein
MSFCDHELFWRAMSSLRLFFSCILYKLHITVARKIGLGPLKVAVNVFLVDFVTPRGTRLFCFRTLSKAKSQSQSHRDERQHRRMILILALLVTRLVTWTFLTCGGYARRVRKSDPSDLCRQSCFPTVDLSYPDAIPQPAPTSTCPSQPCLSSTS